MSVNVNEIAGSFENDISLISAAVRLACENGCRTIVIPHKNNRTSSYEWVLDEPIMLPSDFTLVLDNCFLKLADGTFCNIICNENCHKGNHTLADRQKNIRIIGVGRAVLDGGEYNEFSEHSKNLPKPLVNNCSILMCNVENFKIENLLISNHRYWGMCFYYCSEGSIRNIEFKADLSARLDEGGHTTEYLPRDYEHVYLQNSDGIDLRVGCSNILIENISGFTVDDTVALTALDSKSSAFFAVKGKDNNIHDIIIKNIRSHTFCWTGQVRLLAKDGCKIYSVTVDTVINTIDESLPYRGGCSVMIGDMDYISECDTAMGDIYNVSVSNVHSRAKRAVRLTGPMSHISLDNIFVYNGARTAIHADSPTQLKNVRIKNIFGGESAKLDSVINFSGDVSGKIKISDVYCDNTDYLLRKTSDVEIEFENAENVKFNKSLTTDKPHQYAFWWLDEEEADA